MSAPDQVQMRAANPIFRRLYWASPLVLGVCLLSAACGNGGSVPPPGASASFATGSAEVELTLPLDGCLAGPVRLV
ncbi:MAG: hypothetical protein ACE5FA_09750, partial [Dehalococcoidia bacterium]